LGAPKDTGRMPTSGEIGWSGPLARKERVLKELAWDAFRPCSICNFPGASGKGIRGRSMQGLLHCYPHISCRLQRWDAHAFANQLIG